MNLNESPSLIFKRGFNFISLVVLWLFSLYVLCIKVLIQNEHKILWATFPDNQSVLRECRWTCAISCWEIIKGSPGSPHLLLFGFLGQGLSFTNVTDNIYWELTCPRLISTPCMEFSAWAILWLSLRCVAMKSYFSNTGYKKRMIVYVAALTINALAIPHSFLYFKNRSVHH